MKASLQQQPMYCSRDHNYTSRYILLYSLLFKITPDKESTFLTVPETCADKVITLYHLSLFAGHQGGKKSYLTISKNFHSKPHTLS